MSVPVLGSLFVTDQINISQVSEVSTVLSQILHELTFHSSVSSISLLL